jgi:hypothetical protein
MWLCKKNHLEPQLVQTKHLEPKLIMMDGTCGYAKNHITGHINERENLTQIHKKGTLSVD